VSGVEEKAAGVLITGRQRMVTTAGGLAIVTRSVRSVVSVILTGRIVGPRRLSTDVMDAALDYISGAGLSIRQMAPTRPFELRSGLQIYHTRNRSFTSPALVSRCCGSMPPRGSLRHCWAPSWRDVSVS